MRQVGHLLNLLPSSSATEFICTLMLL